MRISLLLFYIVSGTQRVVLVKQSYFVASVASCSLFNFAIVVLGKAADTLKLYNETSCKQISSLVSKDYRGRRPMVAKNYMPNLCYSY